MFISHRDTEWPSITDGQYILPTTRRARGSRNDGFKSPRQITAVQFAVCVVIHARLDT